MKTKAKRPSLEEIQTALLTIQRTCESSDECHDCPLYSLSASFCGLEDFSNETELNFLEPNHYFIP